MKTLVLSNCATYSYVAMLKSLFPAWDVRGVLSDQAKQWLKHGSKPEFSDFFRSADILLISDLALQPSEGDRQQIFIPHFFFGGLHPDIFRLVNAPLSVLGGGAMYSRLATVSFLLNRTEGETAALFNRDIYAAAGYLSAFDAERARCIATFAEAGIDIRDLFDAWLSRGSFVYTYNHPKSFVLADILLRALIGRLLTEAEARDAKDRLYAVEDYLAPRGTWPVYPEIGEPHGIGEPMVWRGNLAAQHKQLPLEAFVAQTFERLRNHGTLTPELVPRYEMIAAAIRNLQELAA
jgi:hypothetical protein